MAAAPPDLRSQARAAFDRVLLRAERTRALLVGLLFGGLTALAALRVAAELLQPEVLRPEIADSGRALTMLAMLGGMTALEWGLHRDAGERLRTGRGVSAPQAYASAIGEIATLTGGSALLVPEGDGVVVLLLALVALSAFRLVPGATLVSGVGAAVGYLALATVARADGLSFAPRPVSVISTAAIVAATGAALSVMGVAIRRAAVRLATVSVEREQLQRDLLASVEQTHGRIGQDLHDGVGSHLTGLSLYARSLFRRLERGEAVEASEMEEAAAMADDAVAQVRQISRGLMPHEIEPGGLPGALRDLAAGATRVAGLPVTAYADDDLPPLAPEVEGHLYRIAQEAVTNAVKHAAPSQVSVSLEADEGALVLTVEDDGAGMPAAGASGPGVGLRTLRNRAELVGGTLSLDAGADGGTAVRVRIAPRDGRHASAGRMKPPAV